MSTAGDQINRALRLLGVLAEGETPNAAVSQDALTAMNQMLDSWNTERLSVFSTQDQVFNWPTSTISRTLGPTGDFVGNRPILLDDATYFRDPSTNVSFGIKLIVDNDDWWVLPPTHPLLGVYSEQMKMKIIRSMKAADEVWVTNKHLASKVKKYNTNIRIIPNAISVPTWQVERKRSDEVRFGYIGGNHHALDVKESTINLEGYESYVADVDGYAEIMKAAYKLPTMPPTHYHKLYEFFDVSLVPLTTSEFAKCKSHLKMLEAGFSKCAMIVSNTIKLKQSILVVLTFSFYAWIKVNEIRICS